MAGFQNQQGLECAPNANQSCGTKKRCSKCGEIKFLCDFYSSKGRKYGKRSLCKKCDYISRRAWAVKNREKTRAYLRKFYNNNKEKSKARVKLRRQQNPQKALQECRNWRANNPEKVREINKRSNAKTLSTTKGRLNCSMSSRIRYSLNGKKGNRPWERLTGYSGEQLKKHLEKQFKDGMTWENYGEWHIDHIIPVSAFNFEKPEDEDFKRCWSLDNLQPLWAGENFRKSAKIKTQFQPKLIFK